MKLIKKLFSKLPLVGALSLVKSAALLTLGTIPSLALAAQAVAVSTGGLIGTVVSLIVFGVIVGLLLLLVAKAPFIPAEIKQWINYLIYFVVIIIAINFLLGFTGNAFLKY